MTASDALEQGRAAYDRRAWSEAYAVLCAAAREVALAPDDLERLAVAAFLCGHDPECIDAWTRAHHHRLEGGDVDGAVRCAVRLVSVLAHRNEFARMQAWLARAERLLEEHEHDCAIHGYPLIPRAITLFGQGDLDAAYDTFSRALAIGRRFDDGELITFGNVGRGRILIARGRPEEGFPLLDEVLLTITSRELSPLIVGHAYCALMEACFDAFDVRRATEWTEIVRRWCEDQPDIVAYRGDCMVHRAEILQMRGSWQDALEQSRIACRRLADPPGQGALAHGHYRRAELHRVRGEYAEAEDAYREAARLGRPPEPGLALLRLAQGETERAAAMMRRALAECGPTHERGRLLPAYVEVMLADGDLRAARDGVEELAAIARAFGAPLVRAQCEHAQGALLFAEARHAEALAALRRASALWHDLEAPYDLARTRVLVALCCRALGDEDSAQLELDAAASTFRQLGAAPDLARAEALLPPETLLSDRVLSDRETDVLRLVARGMTNRAIADELVISEKTVARHVSNILTKLGVSSRAAATAYAYEHDLLKPTA